MAVEDMLSPYCEDCGGDVDIQTAVVGGTNPDGTHDVHEYELECGHVVEPDATLDVGIVYMLSEVHPHTIEIDGEMVCEDVLDDHLQDDEEFSWGFWELLGLLVAVFVFTRERLRGLWEAVR